DDDMEAWNEGMEAIAAAGAAWATGETVYEGAFARYARADLGDAAPEVRQRAEELNAALRAAKFRHLGDLNSTQTFSAVFRGYGREEGDVYTAVVLGMLGGV